MKYTVIFEQDGVNKRTVIEAETEFYARRKLLDKASGKVLIDSCTPVKPIQSDKYIMDFLNGFRK